MIREVAAEEEAEEMTDREINEAIAEACGWKWEIRRSYRETPAWYRNCNQRDYPPDYCNDLNAMHEAEGVIMDAPETLENDILRKVYRHTLEAVCKRAGWRFAFREFRATARQRAEAFLRTVRKWVDSDATVSLPEK